MSLNTWFPAGSRRKWIIKNLEVCSLAVLVLVLWEAWVVWHRLETRETVVAQASSSAPGGSSQFADASDVTHADLCVSCFCLQIADFGLSNLYQKDKYLQTFCGSPLYASPEIVNGRPYRGPEVSSLLGKGWGSWREKETRTRSPKVLKTPNYASPKIVNGRPYQGSEVSRLQNLPL